ncbi:hypothetical protein ACFPAF_07330 [Hymenobacter endophyticus]|jgi:hypothetical protein|uniref:Periplasmic heavy metal sensor n=1 Tax=Hymenobacter endophyticus TaxID=3076335 RepID=A0ABU3TFP6_9BACT|nr:hypothetical protein [Hymenobacter endophyticus]MDU0370196.1 hypothetical protein [Hymenobacter endophyticus]
MKKITLLVALLLVLQGVSQADERSEGTGLQARATALTRSIADKAHLDEGQIVRVKQLNLRMLTEIEELKARFVADPTLLDQRLAQAQAQYENNLTALLRPTQLALFQQNRANMTALGQH